MAMNITITGQDSSVTAVTKLQNGQLENMGSILGRGRYFSPLHSIKTGCVCARYPCIQSVLGTSIWKAPSITITFLIMIVLCYMLWLMKEPSSG